MSRTRLFILLFGPLPILGASFALTELARPGQTAAPRNLVVEGAVEPTRPSGDGPRSPEADGELCRLCRRQAEQVQRDLSGGAAVVHPPFVVAGNLSQEELDRWYRRTLGPASAALAGRYFRTPPDRPISVLLFANRQSYHDFAASRFGDREVSIFGYYRPAERTVLVDISTGGGTLVHELTHALISFDFPRVPDWFNEGLASLHEQCRFRQDEQGPWIEGLVNWRLPLLQEAVQADRLPPLESLLNSGERFRDGDVGLNYAHARYFCLYLQNRGQLAAFYARFRDVHEQDPSGRAALEAIFPGRSLAEIDADFRRWAMELPSP